MQLRISTITLALTLITYSTALPHNPKATHTPRICDTSNDCSAKLPQSNSFFIDNGRSNDVVPDKREPHSPHPTKAPRPRAEEKREAHATHKTQAAHGRAEERREAGRPQPTRALHPRAEEKKREAARPTKTIKWSA